MAFAPPYIVVKKSNVMRFCATLYCLKNPVVICATRHIPNSDPKFHQPLIVVGVGKSTRASSCNFK